MKPPLVLQASKLLRLRGEKPPLTIRELMDKLQTST